MSCFFAGVSCRGNSMSKVMMRFPLRSGFLEIGIPSPGTTFLYPGL